MSEQTSMALPSFKTIKDLPIENRFYTVYMDDKAYYNVNRVEYEGILSSTHQFIELLSGSTINKAHIIRIHFDTEKTKSRWLEKNNK